jgi:hypothetical protein
MDRWDIILWFIPIEMQMFNFRFVVPWMIPTFLIAYYGAFILHSELVSELSFVWLVGFLIFGWVLAWKVGCFEID